MKFIIIVSVLVLGLFLTACGSGDSAGNVNGTWSAILTDANSNPAISFTTSFTQASGTELNITHFSFTTSGACFASQQVTETGSFGLTGNFNGQVSGAFGMTITATNNPSDVLSLQGTVNGGKITGTWALVGGGSCSGNGSFTMTRM
jgi:hypothetical protein